MKNGSHYLVVLFLIFATNLRAQEMKPYDSEAANKDNEILTNLISIRQNPAYNPEIFYDPNYYLIVKKAGKFAIFDGVKKMYLQQPTFDSITATGNYLKDNQWKNFFYGNQVVNYWPEHPDGIIIRKGKKYGLKTNNDSLVLQTIYDQILPLGEKIFSIKKGKKWGFIYLGSKLAIKNPEFDYVILNTSNDDKNVSVYKNKKEILYNFDGSLYVKKTISQQEADQIADKKNNPYLFKNQNSYRKAFYENGKFGFKNSDNEVVAEAIYDKIEPAGNYTFIVSNFSAKDTLRGVIDRFGKTIIPTQYEKVEPFQYKLFLVGTKKKFGIYDLNGKSVYPQIINSLRGINNTAFFLINERSDNTADLLKIVNEKPVKLLENCVNISFIAESRMYHYNDLVQFQKIGSPLIGLVNANSEKIIPPQFKFVYFDVRQNLILAGTDSVANIVIDPDLTIHRSLKKIISYQNGYFIFKENGKMIAMDRKLKSAKFAYPKLATFFEIVGNVYVGMTDEKLKILYSWFSYNASKTGKKDGVVDFDGNIIIPSEKYDKISVLNFTNREYNLDRLYENPTMLEFNRGIKLLCVNNLGNSTKITIYSSSNIIATFELLKDENWTFGKFSNTIIIQSENQTRIYDIGTKKIILDIPNANFSDDFDGGFTELRKLDNQKNRFIKYSVKGNPIGEAIYSSGIIPQFSNKKQFISKRNGKFGLVTVNENILIPFENDTLYSVDESYFISKKSDIWLIKNLQNEIVKSGFDGIESVNISSSYPSNRYYYILTANGKNTLYDNNFNLVPIDPADKITVNAKNIFAKTEKIWTAYTISGKRLFSIESDQLYNYGAPFYTFSINDQSGLVDESGKIIIKPQQGSVYPYMKNIFTVDDGFKRNLIDRNGNILVDGYTNLNQLQSFRDYFMFNNPEMFTVVTTVKGTTLLDENGKQLLPYGNQEIYDIRDLKFATTKRNGKLGVIDLNEKVIIPFIYDDIYFDLYTRTYTARINDKKYRLTPEGNIFYEEN